MKTLYKRMLIFSGLFLFMAIEAYPQNHTPQPPPPPGHGEEGDQPVPIGNGLGILALLGIAYGAKKVYDARKDFHK